MRVVFTGRLSPSSRREDEGEGFHRIRPGITLALPLSLREGEATRYAHTRSKIFSQT
jgi:hypothetical protein